MIRRSPPWGAIEAFIVAARVGSFKDAAAELDVSPSAFSRRIQALEAHLGARLFDRTETVPRLTPAGRRYLSRLEPGYAAIRAATDWMVPTAGRRPLRIGVSQSFAISWLLPRLQRFRAAHPTIEVTLHTRSGNLDLAGGSADVGILHGDGNLPGLRSRRLFPVSGRIVCAPSLVKGRDPARIAAQLRDLPLLEALQPPDIWRVWQTVTGEAVSESPQRVYFDSVLVMYEAAAMGLGLAVGMTPTVERFLADGRLVAPLPRVAPLPGAYYVAALPTMLAELPVRTFWRWLVEEAERG